jgi:hypothetical protein
MLEKSTDKLIHMTKSSCAIKLLIGDKREGTAQG